MDRMIAEDETYAWDIGLCDGELDGFASARLWMNGASGWTARCSWSPMGGRRFAKRSVTCSASGRTKTLDGRW